MFVYQRVFQLKTCGLTTNVVTSPCLLLLFPCLATMSQRLVAMISLSWVIISPFCWWLHPNPWPSCALLCWLNLHYWFLHPKFCWLYMYNVYIYTYIYIYIITYNRYIYIYIIYIVYIYIYIYIYII